MGSVHILSVSVSGSVGEPLHESRILWITSMGNQSGYMMVCLHLKGGLRETEIDTETYTCSGHISEVIY